MADSELSCYILTRNSERRLPQVLESVRGLADDLLVLDSGSQDRTESICRAAGARFEFRRFDDFRRQRTYALSRCRHDWVLELDSDEVLSATLRKRLVELKTKGLGEGDAGLYAYAIRRDWFALGRRVHAFYPVKCPDWPVRLYRRDKVGYQSGKIVHEAPKGHKSRVTAIDAPILHYTCDTLEQMYDKLNQYTTLLARDMHQQGERTSAWRMAVLPWLVWLRFYVLRGGWLDGRIGRIHGRYLRDMVWLKHAKLRHDFGGQRADGSRAAVTLRDPTECRSMHDQAE